jgi:hypothetical protein
MLLAVAVSCPAQQVIQIFDSVCMAPLVDACVQQWPAKAESVTSPAALPECPPGYKSRAVGGGYECLIDTQADGAAIAGRYIACQRRVESTPTGQSCIRQIKMEQMLSAQTELNNTLKTDMRTLLHEFCNTYGTVGKCDELLPKVAK